MAPQIVSYALDDSTAVSFEIEPPPGFQSAGVEQTVRKIRDAVTPAVEAAKVVLDKVREIGPDQVEVKFGIKVSGKVDWLVARVATEGNFEIRLSWKPTGSEDSGSSGDD